MAQAQDVQKLATLARISVPPAKIQKFAAEFDAILAYVGQLETLKVEKGKPIVPYTNIFRADGPAHARGEWTETLVAQFPAREGNYLSVKQIISHD